MINIKKKKNEKKFFNHKLTQGLIYSQLLLFISLPFPLYGNSEIELILAKLQENRYSGDELRSMVQQLLQQGLLTYEEGQFIKEKLAALKKGDLDKIYQHINNINQNQENQPRSARLPASLPKNQKASVPLSSQDLKWETKRCKNFENKVDRILLIDESE